MREFIDEMLHYDFSIRCRETFEQEVTLKDEDGTLIDLNGKTAAAQVRPSPGSPDLTAAMHCEVDIPSATITMLLTSAQTAEITPGKYAYDLCIIEDAEGEEIRKYLLGGVFSVFPSVTD
ncbi:MAG: hypothetical protein IJU38_07025 [Clostridia bacterium]|nr:hypothetical protein [Clostridia bacterium]